MIFDLAELRIGNNDQPPSSVELLTQQELTMFARHKVLSH